MKHTFTLLLALLCLTATGRTKYNFNMGWLLGVGEEPAEWKTVTLPHAFNEDEAFRLDIHDLTDTVMWYTKHFSIPKKHKGGKVFIEFEGVRQAADFYINGQHVGLHENGVMAVGLDLTPYILYGKDNEIRVRIDNSWTYHEKRSNSRYQWNDRNFNANYGGIPKNVWLHVTGPIYQTLPLWSDLRTTGTYIYATDFDIPQHSATVHAEAQVRNESAEEQTAELLVSVKDAEGNVVTQFAGQPVDLPAGGTLTLTAQQSIDGLHFWSWGYGYLYDVKTSVYVDGKSVDDVTTRTGFRKAEFGNGQVRLNDRVLMMKGYAQRTSNEWPAVGMSVPAWLSDYSNSLMVEGNANLVRWMHVTPWKQDIESCDRVGLIQAMPAGDSERDVEGERWRQRTELMRDAIIYNRNNPSILFYECGNESISPEHMMEMKALRDSLDPHGGRAIGSREMLDIHEAEYGGEMLYINKSAHHPMWAMEYCRDEALRKYWDNFSYPYHKQGQGNDSYYSTMTQTSAKRTDAKAYNQNQDSFAIEHVHRWYDYWLERPGTGSRVSSGGTKIIFSDSNTHFRGTENYRRSGSVDAMRIAKDSYFTHQVMWDGWVDIEQPRIHIIGHWNYEPGTVKPVNVVSSAPVVELVLNGRSLGTGEQKYAFLHSFPSVTWEAGDLVAIGRDAQGNELCRAQLHTVGQPRSLRLTAMQSPDGWKADGADMILLEVEVTDADGQRCPLANNLVHFSLDGPAEWRGGIALGEDNYILSEDLPVECGVNRALLRSLTKAGKVTVTAQADGLESATLTLTSQTVKQKDGLSEYIAGDHMPLHLDRGETPLTPSYTDTKRDIAILGVQAGANNDEAGNSYDDNELSEWRNDGRASTAWITYRLEPGHRLDEICMKLTGWRSRSYPLDIYVGDSLVWHGETPQSLGYVHLFPTPIAADSVSVCLRGTARNEEAFGDIVELTAPVAGELDLYKAEDGANTKQELRIVEIEFKEFVGKEGD